MTHPLLAKIREAGIIATLRAPNADAAYDAVSALLSGGIKAIEVTYTTPDAGAVIAKIRDRFGDDIILGAGTVTTSAQATEARDAGAHFLVSPGFDAEVFDAIVATGAMSMIGGYTPSEVQNLAKRGADIIKFFPGSIGGPAALEALRGPFPNLAYIPTGGVDTENLARWLAAGALAVGAGGQLIPAEAMENGDFEIITMSAKRFIAALRAAREATAKTPATVAPVKRNAT